MSGTEPSQFAVNPKPFVYSTHRFFYPVGNSPARALQRFVSSLPGAVSPLRALLLGCGDLRNVLYTILSMHSDDIRLDVTMCDVEAAVHSRNALLIAMVSRLSKVHSSNSKDIWALYYHQFITHQQLKLLRAELQCFLDVIQAPSVCICPNKKTSSACMLCALHASRHGKWLRMPNARTVHVVLKLLRAYLQQATELDVEPNQNKARFALAREQRQAYFKEFAVQRNNAGSENRLDGHAVATVAPFDNQVMLYALTWLFNGYQEKGFYKDALSGSETESCYPNPLFFISTLHPDDATAPNLSHNFTAHYESNPVKCFPLAAELVTIMSSTSPDHQKIAELQAGAIKSSLSQFQTWLHALQKALSKNALIVRPIVGDAIDVAQLFVLWKEHNITSLSLPANSLADLSLEAVDYDVKQSQALTSAPRQFDVIDTSNVSDYTGMLHMVLACAPLLARGGALHTDILFGSKESLWTKNLLISPLLLGALLGVQMIDTIMNFDFTPVSLMCLEDHHMPLMPLIVWKQSNLFALAAKKQVSSSKPLAEAFPSLSNQDLDSIPVVLELDSQLLRTICIGLFRATMSDALKTPKSLGKCARGNAMERGRYSLMTLIWLMRSIVQSKHLKFEEGENCDVVLRKLESDILEIARDTLAEDFVHQFLFLLRFSEIFNRTHQTNTTPLCPASIFSSASALTRVVFLMPGNDPGVLYLNASSASISCYASITSPTFSHWFHIHHCYVRIVSRSPETYFVDSSVNLRKCKLHSDEQCHQCYLWQCAHFVLESANTNASDCQTAVSFFAPIGLLENETRLKIQLHILRPLELAAVAVQKWGKDMVISQADYKSDRVSTTLHAPVSFASLSSSISSSTSAIVEKMVETKASVETKDENITTSSFCCSSRLVVSEKDQYLQLAAYECKISGDPELADALSKGALLTVTQSSPSTLNLNLQLASQTKLIWSKVLSFPGMVDLNKADIKFSRKQAFVNVNVAPLLFADPPWTQKTVVVPSNPFAMYWNTDRRTASLWTFPRVCPILDSCPILDYTYEPLRISLTKLLNNQLVTCEQKLMTDSVSSNAFTSLKQSLLSLFEGTVPRMVCFVNTTNQPDFLVYISSIRMISSLATIAFDVSVCSLADLPQNLIPKQVQGYMMTTEEQKLWRCLLPASIESARFGYEHAKACEYAMSGTTIPLAQSSSRRSYCSCGLQKNLPEALRTNYARLANYFTRAAILPLFTPFLAQKVHKTFLGIVPRPESTPSVIKCCTVCATQVNVSACTRCRAVFYCGKEHQRSDWKSHKLQCTPPQI